jgi:hypothetical protein
MASNPLVGVWRLLSWENRSADGTIDYPLGREAMGLIIYTEDGYMSVAIGRAERKPFSAGDLLEGSREEKAGAAASYVSYCGRYDFRGDSVVHHVELSLFPNWIGLDQERLFDVSGDVLTLRTRPMPMGGADRSAHVVWERV